MSDKEDSDKGGAEDTECMANWLRGPTLGSGPTAPPTKITAIKK